MRIEYRFLQTRDGVTRFARITLTAVRSDRWDISFRDALGHLATLYGEAITRGLSLAIAEQDRRGGQRHGVDVEALAATAVDTSEDAVECATAIAAWKSFGNDAREVALDITDGRWSVGFTGP